MKVHVGTSGYQYKAWAGDFYPTELKPADWLPYYASQFNSVEINSSFYRLPTAKTIEHWYEQVPADFVFAIKGSRYLTHQLRLKDSADSIERFFGVAGGLRDKLGAVLWQLPESLHTDLERLERFASALSSHPVARTIHQAIELRHQSWFNAATYELLRRYDLALVINQSSRWPVVPIATASWSYFRFHGPTRLYSSGYSKAQLADWAKQAKRLSRGDVFAYFNNDNGNFAPRNAKTLQANLVLQLL